VLGAWLLKCRNDLQGKGQVDLSRGPSTIIHETLVGDSKEVRYREKVKLVIKALNAQKGEKCIVIGNSQNEAGRALLARDVKASAVEPIACKRLVKFVKELEGSQGSERLNVVLELVKDVMSGAEVAALKNVVKAVTAGKRKKQLDVRQAACVEITRSQDLKPILHLLEEIRKQPSVWIYRRELYSALCAALRVIISGTHASLLDAVWEIQNRRRHVGRRFAKRSIGSTLLVKGLEFDHAIIVDVDSFKRNDLYVALTRASRSVTVISESCILNPIGC
jgi:DNA helicase-2/ATP-dependent DNA helicase PcrA